MSSLDELISRAKGLHAEGHSTSQIADELSLSVETVTWLLTQQKDRAEAPKDVHIDWTAVSAHADMLRTAASMMLKQYYYAQAYPGDEAVWPTVIVGIAQSGIPLATLMADEEECMLSVYYPKKHAPGDNPVGSMSSCFAAVQGQKCLIVDDVITTGRTLTETIGYLRSHGASPVGICVLFDKPGIKEVDGVPVFALFKISRID